ncbi:MAG: hypothetical protein L0H73_12065 [Nitrococcus sp.]|nr:hypothetical protein [Nitrococcus sp.]
MAEQESQTFPPAGGQLDLFVDNEGTAALYDLCVALRGRNLETAKRALATLAVQAPEHRLRPATERLTHALVRLPTRLSPADASAELKMLEQTLRPDAQDVLGAQAHDLLAPFWQRLADALAGAPFDPERPALHASYAYAQCLDWCRAAAAVEAVLDYAAQPVLLARLAEARYRNGDRHGAIATWAALCWRFPAAAEKVMEGPELPDTRLRVVWIRFCDQNLDPPPDTSLFPAYLLLSEPELARTLPADLSAGDSVGENAYQAVHQLLQRDSIDTRRAVHNARPWLLEAYLRAFVTT